MSSKRNRNTRYVMRKPEPSEESTVTDGESLRKCIIENAISVNFRKEASRESEVLRQVNHGDVLELVDRIGEFCKLRMPDGQIGFVVSSFCREVDE